MTQKLGSLAGHGFNMTLLQLVGIGPKWTLRPWRREANVTHERLDFQKGE